MEVRVSGEEFAAIKKNRKEIEKRLHDLEGLERTLKALRLQFLMEQRERLEKRLAEVGEGYLELSEFERKATRDKEFLVEFRKRLSEENRELRQRLEGKKR